MHTHVFMCTSVHARVFMSVFTLMLVCVCWLGKPFCLIFIKYPLIAFIYVHVCVCVCVCVCVTDVFKYLVLLTITNVMILFFKCNVWPCT